MLSTKLQVKCGNAVSDPTQKLKLFIKDFFSKFDQIRRKMQN